MDNKIYRCIGIMTGNSLDAVDVVLTEFCHNSMQDICGYSQAIPTTLSNQFRQLKFLLSQNGGDIKSIALNPNFQFKQLHDQYISLVADTVLSMLSRHHIDSSTIDLIGFHGQTCAHCPPSIAQSHDPEQIYTIQVGSGQMLADLTGIPVAFDFRSDDLMNYGEAAPLAPVHNKHIAQDLQEKDIFPVAFCNGGNTGNISLITQDNITGMETVIGWDVGPFNHFIDLLMRQERHLPCDFNGETGKLGKIDYRLLRNLFENAVQTNHQKNFITMPAPKSSDPAWYKAIPELFDSSISFEDRIRTVEFFSAYIFAYNLSLIPQNLSLPKYFLIFGGGWNNPVVLQDFKNILTGNIRILPEHQTVFQQIYNSSPIVEWSDIYNYNGQYMEARIFADMAKCKLTKEPFSYPETTGCLKPTIGGIIAKPGGHNQQLWSRAAPGWHHH